MVTKRDAGEPSVISHTLPGTPEQVAYNRERLRQKCEDIASRIAGCPTDVKLDWPDEDQGNDRAGTRAD